jgi:hypothetical protein
MSCLHTIFIVKLYVPGTIAAVGTIVLCLIIIDAIRATKSRNLKWNEKYNQD